MVRTLNCCKEICIFDLSKTRVVKIILKNSFLVVFPSFLLYQFLILNRYRSQSQTCLLQISFYLLKTQHQFLQNFHAHLNLQTISLLKSCVHLVNLVLLYFFASILKKIMLNEMMLYLSIKMILLNV